MSDVVQTAAVLTPIDNLIVGLANVTVSVVLEVALIEPPPLELAVTVTGTTLLPTGDAAKAGLKKVVLAPGAKVVTLGVIAPNWASDTEIADKAVLPVLLIV